MNRARAGLGHTWYKLGARFLSRLHGSAIAALAGVLLLIVALLDHFTGRELSFSFFYLFPVTLATWYGNRWLSITFCLVAAFIWFSVDQWSGADRTINAIALWNAGIRLGFFLLVASLLMEIKARLTYERSLARSDGLTNALNSRGFRQGTQAIMEQARRQGLPLALAYFDLDNFKKVNDQFGHAEGDRLLQTVATLLMDNVRPGDCVGRIGGDEFAIALPNTNLSSGQRLMERLLRILQSARDDHRWPIGFSIGVAIFDAIPEDVERALKSADALMYRVKSSGKDNIVFEQVACPADGMG